MNVFPYYFARSVARSLDRQGSVPPLWLRLLVTVPCGVVVVGGAGLIVFAAADIGLWSLGIIN
jgi:hypothetical protein